MPKKPKVEIINPNPKITASRSILNKGKTAKKGHAFFTVSYGGMKLTEEHETKNLSAIGELALKGRLIDAFKEQFKDQLEAKPFKRDT